ncbi:MAG: helix-turn-helix domain-containing protein [Deltaproteobacteria bacterium]
MRRARARVPPARFWTSAGISAGIDLALALITEDLGAPVARDVARQLVVYAQRPGGQTQFSNLLSLGDPSGQFAALHLWVQQHLAEPLAVARLAQQVKMSPRSFARAYVLETGVTPAKGVERLRLEAARAALDAGGRSLQEIAEQVGLSIPSACAVPACATLARRRWRSSAAGVNVRRERPLGADIVRFLRQPG